MSNRRLLAENIRQSSILDYFPLSNCIEIRGYVQVGPINITGEYGPALVFKTQIRYGVISSLKLSDNGRSGTLSPDRHIGLWKRTKMTAAMS